MNSRAAVVSAPKTYTYTMHTNTIPREDDEGKDLKKGKQENKYIHTLANPYCSICFPPARYCSAVNIPERIRYKRKKKKRKSR